MLFRSPPFNFRRATLAAAIGLAAVPFAVMAQGKDPVRVGLVSSKSGVFAQQGEEVIRAVKFAIEEANANARKAGVTDRVEFEIKDLFKTPIEALFRGRFGEAPGVSRP